jgi:hypothetical protein
MLTRRSPLSSLPAGTDFDIEKMRSEWRDEVYQNWRTCKASRPPATAMLVEFASVVDGCKDFTELRGLIEVARARAMIDARPGRARPRAGVRSGELVMRTVTAASRRN